MKKEYQMKPLKERRLSFDKLENDKRLWDKDGYFDDENKYFYFEEDIDEAVEQLKKKAKHGDVGGEIDILVVKWEDIEEIFGDAK